MSHQKCLHLRIIDVPDPQSIQEVEEDPNLLHAIGVPLIVEMVNDFIDPLHRHAELTD